MKISEKMLVAGPCSAESEDQVMRTAGALAAGGVKIFRAGLWKPRTMPSCFEGVGKIGLEWLKRVKRETGMSVGTEVATTSHVEMAVEAGLDILWVGARTVTDPFAMQEVAEALRGVDIPVFVKNPVCPDLDLWCGAIQRLENAGVRRICAIHRGFSVYAKGIYRNSPLWSIPFELKRRYPEMALFCDPSHIGGKRELVVPISQQALDLGFDGLFIESHCSPDMALSDREQQITPEELLDIVASLKVRSGENSEGAIDLLREKIDELDGQLVSLLAKRMEISREIGRYKRDNGVPVLQPMRYDTVMEDRKSRGEELGLDGEFVENLMRSIHEESVRQQIRPISKKNDE